MDEMATVVVMSIGIGGEAALYEDDEARQALVDLNALEDLVLEYERKRAHLDRHNSWIS